MEVLAGHPNYHGASVAMLTGLSNSITLVLDLLRADLPHCFGLSMDCEASLSFQADCWHSGAHPAWAGNRDPNFTVV